MNKFPVNSNLISNITLHTTSGFNVCTKLGYLVKRNLCGMYKSESEKKWRFYTITDKGKEVLEKIKDMK